MYNRDSGTGKSQDPSADLPTHNLLLPTLDGDVA
jgi:hypothetical protein